jgi:hypothetical protein
MFPVLVSRGNFAHCGQNATIFVFNFLNSLQIRCLRESGILPEQQKKPDFSGLFSPRFFCLYQIRIGMMM